MHEITWGGKREKWVFILGRGLCPSLSRGERLELVWPSKGRICDQNLSLIDYLSAIYRAVILQNRATNSFWADPQEFTVNIWFHNRMRSAMCFTCTRGVEEIKWKKQQFFLKILKEKSWFSFVKNLENVEAQQISNFYFTFYMETFTTPINEPQSRVEWLNSLKWMQLC